MRLIDVPLALTTVAIAFSCGAVAAVVAVRFLQGSKRLRLWLARLRGGTQILCPCCGERTVEPYVVDGWHRLPGWLRNDRTGVEACSATCARALGHRALDGPRLNKVVEVTDVSRWATGTLPEGDGEWISVTAHGAKRKAEQESSE